LQPCTASHVLPATLQPCTASHVLPAFQSMRLGLLTHLCCTGHALVSNHKHSNTHTHTPRTHTHTHIHTHTCTCSRHLPPSGAACSAVTSWTAS
jgi:hypothetical protein